LYTLYFAHKILTPSGFVLLKNDFLCSDGVDKKDSTFTRGR